MKILFITETFPYPLDSGGKIVSYQLLQMLCTKHRVHVLALSSHAPTLKDRQAITALGATVTVLPSTKRTWRYKQSKLELVSSLIHFQPFFLSLFYEQKLAKITDDLLAHEKFDNIFIDHLGMAQYLPKKKTQQWILCEHNIEYKLHEQIYQMPGISMKEKLFHLYDAIMLQKYEKHILCDMDQIIVLSHEDQSQLVAMGINTQNIILIPPFYHPKPHKKQPQTKKLLFVGNLLWNPNADAMRWFLQDIFPILHRQDPKISITIIGDGGDTALKHFKNNPSIHILGNIQNLDQYFTNTNVFILPIRIGGGVRIKALTAFAHSVPVVSTSVGMRGIEAKQGIHYLEANTSLNFAQQIINLLKNPTLQANISTNAITFLQKYHTRDTIQKHFLASYGKTNY
jgi:polysaccharide biosynthesis protein PslH